MKGHRIAKVTSQLKREISLLMKEYLPDEFGLVTLTDLHVTADFKDAKVYISVLNEEMSERALGILKENTQDMQAILGRKLKMKFTPQLEFILDTASDKVNRVEKLLEEIEDGS